MVKSKEAWINTKLKEIQKKCKQSEARDIIDRKYIPYLGKNYAFKIYEKVDIYKCSVYFKNNEFIAYVPKHMRLENKNKELRQLLINLIVNESLSLVKEKVAYYSKLLGVFPRKLQIKDQKSSWGTCSSLGNIYLNYRILFAPIHIMDYVIIHELCHLKHMNHSKEYWQLVGSICPNYSEYRKYLKEHGYKLDI